MAVAFVLALAVRLTYLAAFRHSPFFGHLLVDAEWHDTWAWDWATGAWKPGTEAFFRAPLYPFFLSLIYRVFGHDLVAARVVAMVLGASGVAAVAGTAGRFGRRAGWWAAGIAALYGPWIHFDGELLIPALLLPLLAWAMYFATATPGWRPALASAALLGLAVIARPNALVLLAPVGWLASRAAVGGWRVSWPRVAVVAGLALAPAVLVTVENWRAEGDFVFVGSQGGVNFAAGNHARATGRSVEIPGLTDAANWKEFLERSKIEAEKAAGRPLSSRGVSDYWFGVGTSWIREHPGDALGLTLRKLYFLVNAYECPNNRDLYFMRPWPLRPLLWTTWWFAFPWGIVFPLAVAGFFVGRRAAPRGVVGALAVWSLLYGASLVPFFITARFRMGLVPPLIVLAAVALGRWREMVRPVPGIAFVLALLVSNSPFFQVRVENRGQELARLGAVLLKEGDFDRGIRVLEDAVKLDPNGIAPTYLLADAYLETGREPRRCLELYERVVARRPDDAKARFGLASAYLAMERWEDADRELEVVVHMDPTDVATWVNLGVAREALGDTTSARIAYRKGIELAPTEDLAYARLAGMDINAGRPEAALETLAKGIEKAPGSFLLRFQRAALLLQLGRPNEAAPEVNEVLRLQPNNPDALRLRQILLQKNREQN